MAFLESITMIALLIRVDFFFQRRGNESQLLLSEERQPYLDPPSASIRYAQLLHSKSPQVSGY